MAARAMMLDSFFALHPAMPEFCARCTREKHAARHRTAWLNTPYRDLSHFDGQDVLESGFAGPGRVAIRLAQPRAAKCCRRRLRCDERAGHRPTLRARLVLRGAPPTDGWTYGGAAQATRYRDASRRPLSPSRSPVGVGALEGLRLDKTAQGDDMRPSRGHQ